MPDVDFEFDVAADARPGPESDVIDGGARRLAMPGWLAGGVARSLLVGLVGLATAVAIAAQGRQGTPAVGVPGRSPSPTPATASSSVTVGPGQLALAQMVLRAQAGDGLHDDLMSDTAVVCPRVSVDDAAQAVLAVLRGAVPGYVLVDHAVTRGARGTVCGLEVRVRNGVGATILVTVLAPPDADNTSFVVWQGNDRTTVLDVEVLLDSWSVQVGWIGQTGNGPTSAELQAIARDARLIW